jgi:undecaprenyl diphosphate synthase
MEQKEIPSHVAVIADGNRRWARERGFPTIEGHRRGAENFIKLSRAARSMGIKVFTLWGFSTENWKRATDEVGYLMGLFEQMIDREMQSAVKEQTRIVQLGRKDRFTPSLREKIKEAEEKTKHNSTYHLVIALDYGGKDELVRGGQ